MPDVGGPTIDDLRALQRRLGLLDAHVAYIGPHGFRVAHTDRERHSGAPLTDCDFHGWLVGLDEPPVIPGVYVVTPHEPDAYSEPFNADPWDFGPICDEDCPCPA